MTLGRHEGSRGHAGEPDEDATTWTAESGLAVVAIMGGPGVQTLTIAEEHPEGWVPLDPEDPPRPRALEDDDGSVD